MVDDPMREAIEAELVIERDGWAAERVARVMERLQPDIAASERFDTLVIWSDQHTAFTCPGRTIYISRRLLERMPDDDTTAFVLAHELAHHRLGHLPSHVVLRFTSLEVWLWLFRHWVERSDHERDADLLAIELCIEAGYSAECCVVALELLDMITLDYRDVDGSLGAEDEPEGERRRGGYPPVRDRIALVRKHVVMYALGERTLKRVTAERVARARHRRAIAAGVASSAAMLALVLWRRRL